jgi:hypothetical protein
MTQNTNRASQISEDLRTLGSLSSHTPKALGYCWETGQLEGHVKVDDGLDQPFYLPIDLCSTPKVTLNARVLFTELTSLGVHGHYHS